MHEIHASSDHYVLCDEGAKPIRMWVDGVPYEEQAVQQLVNTSRLPFIYRHVAAMPDMHSGMGAVIGSVIATTGAAIPSAVGVDIGCGMAALETSLTRADLPENLKPLRLGIEARVPHGRTDNGGPNDRGAWHNVPEWIADLYHERLAERLEEVVAKHPKIGSHWLTRAPQHLGTLGTGNHFIEICVDKNDAVWIMLHSGSRGAGNRIGSYFVRLAKEMMKRWFISLPDPDLAYFPQGTEGFVDYMEAASWAQEFAFLNRQVMVKLTEEALRDTISDFEVKQEINCHHNFIAHENHFGTNVLITRKGATRAREDEMVIIPGSMGARSYIARGLGNRDSFMSCSHGAGRAMSRTAARKTFTVEDHVAATEGVECAKDESVLDETPGAYKDIDSVMAAQSRLVEPVHILKQVLCVKG